MTTYTEGAHTGEFLISEAEGTRSREFATIAVSQTLSDGQIVGKVLVGALSGTAAALGTNTGNGTVGSITVDAGALVGDYTITIIEPNTNLGAFVVENPDGAIDGHGVVGTAYNGSTGVNFTLSDGATDFVAGDSFVITVVAAAASDDAQYKALNLSATDGSQTPAGILYGAVTTGGSATAKGVIIARDAEVNGFLIEYPSGASSPQKAAIRAQLNGLGIYVR